MISEQIFTSLLLFTCSFGKRVASNLDIARTYALKPTRATRTRRIGCHIQWIIARKIMHCSRNKKRFKLQGNFSPKTIKIPQKKKLLQSIMNNCTIS